MQNILLAFFGEYVLHTPYHFDVVNKLSPITEYGIIALTIDANFQVMKFFTHILSFVRCKDHQFIITFQFSATRYPIHDQTRTLQQCPLGLILPKCKVHTLLCYLDHNFPTEDCENKRHQEKSTTKLVK